MRDAPQSKRSIDIALAGLGTVGRGFLKLFLSRRKEIEAELGVALNLRWIADRHPEKKLKGLRTGATVVKNFKSILEDPETDIVIELVGGADSAKGLVIDALKSGKHVITANKLLISREWEKIFSQAAKNNCHVFYEAAVASGIPIIRSMRDGLISSRINAVRGILNGTTNFILTRMIHNEMSYKDALKQAQAKGFAEANPAFDVNGADTAHKLSILASLALKRWVNPKDIYREGIEGLETEDIIFAQNHLGLTLRLLGIMQTAKSGEVSVRVHPALFSVNHPFATVHDEFNAISLAADAAGDLYFHGKGAGAEPAGSAVLSDLVELSRRILSFAPVSGVATSHEVRIQHMNETEHAYYLRLWAQDKPGILSRISAITGRNKISIAQIYQGDNTGFEKKGNRVPIILTTHEGQEKRMQKAMAELRRMKEIKIETFLRIDHHIQ